LEQAGIAFLFAPRYHPALRHAAPVRAELGIRTTFNFLAPLANPARPKRQMVGVSDRTMAEKLVGVLAAGGTERALVVYGHDGLDELTTTTTSTVVDMRAGEEVVSYEVDPAALGLAPARGEDLKGADPATNAGFARAVLDDQPGPHRDIVLLNAAAALVAADAAADLAGGLDAARRSLSTGAAAAALERLVAVSNEAAAAGGAP
jgi:anthranilate phosphoribosyltransferase